MVFIRARATARFSGGFDTVDEDHAMRQIYPARACANKNLVDLVTVSSKADDEILQ